MFKSGNRSAALLIKEITSTPKRAKKIRKSLQSNNISDPVPYTANEALAFLINNRLTKKQYCSIRVGSKIRKSNIYPPYEKVLIAKKQCYPENIIITENSAEIPLQDLLNHTVERLFKMLTLNNINGIMGEYELLCKWGCDGSSGQAQYRINFSTSQSVTDSDLFMFSFVPLQINCTANDQKIIIWQNPRPSSTKFCRPIKFIFKKETVESTRDEVDKIETQIKNLDTTDVILNNKVLKIKHNLIFSMVDGKVIIL